MPNQSKEIKVKPRDEHHERLRSAYAGIKLTPQQNVMKNDILNLYKSCMIYNKKSAETLLNKCLTHEVDIAKQHKQFKNKIITHIANREKQHNRKMYRNLKLIDETALLFVKLIKLILTDHIQ